MRATLFAGLLFGFALGASAQPVSGEPEVRRAIPVNSPAPAESPVQPFRPPARQEGAPAQDENGSIRIAPSSSQTTDRSREQLDVANSLYSRKMYDLAVPEYEKYLVASGSGAGRDGALFRLAECHRMLGNLPAARSGYEKLVMEFRSGEFAGAGAYRLGEFLFGEKNYDAANSQFQTAAKESKDPEVRLTALYFSARSLDYLKREAEAREAYRAVVAVEGNNPYREHARMAAADIDARSGKKEEALVAYEELAKPPKTAIAAEAALKAAALAAALGQKDKASALYDRAINNPDGADFKAAALIGAMRLRYQAGSYKSAADLASGVDQLPPETRPEALQILAASFRQLGNNLEARRAYDRILKEFPESAAAPDARYQRLVCLYTLKDKNLPAEVDAFLEKTTDPKDRMQAQLLKAETLFKGGDYAGAGKVYDALLARDLPDDFRADALYKLAWCLAATGQHPAAISSYSEFLTKFPDHKLAPTALVQRAISKQASKAFDSAIEDFDSIAAKYPGTKENELALLQKGMTLGQQQKYVEMARAFEKLLADFPKSPAAAQANFWLGWAAFERKDYKAALPLLEAARTLDATQYGDRASLRIILAYYYLEDRDAVTREAANYKGGNLPAEITLWLAARLMDEANFSRAEQLLLPLAANPATMPADAWIYLAESEIRLGKFQAARGPVEKYLATARDPASRARALLASARVSLGLKNPSEAAPLVEEALVLQPEGRLNAEGRILQGDVLLAQGSADAAARAYMTVAVLLDDPVLTPDALQKASVAYQRANNRFEAEKALAELKKRYPDFQKTSKAQKPKP